MEHSICISLSLTYLWKISIVLNPRNVRYVSILTHERKRMWFSSFFCRKRTWSFLVLSMNVELGRSEKRERAVSTWRRAISLISKGSFSSVNIIDRIPRQIFRFNKKFPIYVCIIFLPENYLTLGTAKIGVLSKSDFLQPVSALNFRLKMWKTDRNKSIHI